MIMLLIFPLVFLGALAIWIASAICARSVSDVPAGQTVAVLSLAAAYGAGLLAVSLYPYYEDNGVPEFIAWPHRWAWAAEYAGWLALLIVLPGYALSAVLRRFRKP